MLDLHIAWDDLDAAFDALEAEVEDTVRGLTVMLWNGILAKTPQYDGRMAASWSYCLGVPQYVDRSKEVEFIGPRATRLGKLPVSQGLYRGHPVAVAVANAANAGRDSAFRLGDMVYLTNGVDHGEGPYSQDVEDGNVRLRPQNLPGKPVQRTLDQIGVRYDTDISRERAQRMRTLRIDHGTTDLGA